MNVEHEMVSASFKMSFKYKDSFISIGGEAALFIKDKETVTQAFDRAWKDIQMSVDKQIEDSVKSLKETK